MKSADFNAAMERVGCPVRALPHTAVESTLVEALIWACQELSSLRGLLAAQSANEAHRHVLNVIGGRR